MSARGRLGMVWFYSFRCGGRRVVKRSERKTQTDTQWRLSWRRLGQCSQAEAGAGPACGWRFTNSGSRLLSQGLFLL